MAAQKLPWPVAEVENRGGRCRALRVACVRSKRRKKNRFGAVKWGLQVSGSSERIGQASEAGWFGARRPRWPGGVMWGRLVPWAVAGPVRSGAVQASGVRGKLGQGFGYGSW